MGGIANGIAYHGGFKPYCATFLTFSDYMRGSVRLAALAGLPVTYVWTHDSVGLGEDGPTHQPVEQPTALRAIPNLWYVRPGDANEAVAAWALSIERRDGPVALGLTRQKLTTLPETAAAAREGVRRGGYVLREVERRAGRDRPDPRRHRLRARRGRPAPATRSRRTGSGPGWSACPASRRSSARTRPIANRSCPGRCRRRVSVEAGVTLGWDRYAGDDGAMIGIDHFGASAPGADGPRALRLHPRARRRRRPAGRPGRPPGPDPEPDPGHQPAGLGLGRPVQPDASTAG